MSHSTRHPPRRRPARVPWWLPAVGGRVRTRDGGARSEAWDPAGVAAVASLPSKATLRAAQALRTEGVAQQLLERPQVASRQPPERPLDEMITW